MRFATDAFQLMLTYLLN